MAIQSNIARLAKNLENTIPHKKKYGPCRCTEDFRESGVRGQGLIIHVVECKGTNNKRGSQAYTARVHLNEAT